MAKANSTTPAAIPTIYNGIQLKSRLEAQCAAMLDLFGWEWQYEPFSIMLPNNVNYMPDFWIPAQKTIMETRGYSTAKGNRQLDEFGVMVNEGLTVPNFGTVCRFVAAMVDEVDTYSSPMLGCGHYEATMVAYCDSCKQWVLMGIGEQCCPCCICSSISLRKAMVLNIENGKLLLNGVGCEGWKK